MSEKRCTKCKIDKPITNFYRDPYKRDGLQSWCKSCLKCKLYGVSPEDLAALTEAQEGKCPGCLGDLSELRVNVDHCHTTGKVRGLLCHNCNLNLGQAKDLPAILRNLADYLERHALTNSTS